MKAPWRLLVRLLLLALVTGMARGELARSAQAEEERAWIVVLGTTDLHGNIYPIDYTRDRPAERGLAKLATLIRRTRQDHPELLLLDCGDTIQGTPLAFYHARRNPEPIDPMMKVMNALRYDAMAVGNHEYNFGLSVLTKAQGEANFPWLSANTYRRGTDETAFPPYLVKEVKGVRLGILGLTTPGIPYWEEPAHYAGLEFRESVSEARKWVRALRERERVDAVIVAMHMGLEEDLASGRTHPGDQPGDNAALAIARTVPGIDLLLLGHTHRELSSLVVNGVLLAQAGRWGERLVRADLYFARPPGGSWSLRAKGARTLPVQASVPADAEILALAEPYHRETQAWLDRVIGMNERELDVRDGYVRDSALLDLVQRVQREAGQADVSLAAHFNLRARLPAGPIRVRDVAGLYIYENTLVVIEVTGAQLKAALEHSARFFRPHRPGASAAELIDPRIPGYNFDVAEGVSYVIDVRRPLGDRIQDLRFEGQPLAPDRRLKLAINNYRFNGGGGYTMFKDAPVLFRSSEEIRDLIIAWVERNQRIPGEPTGNWSVRD